MTIEEIESSALGLPQEKRAKLAASLLGSLPAVLDEEEEGIDEALRRSREMDDDPGAEMTWKEVKAGLRRSD
ncbi:MAG: addiction module protein [Verrucomicrobiota bacterium]